MLLDEGMYLYDYSKLRLIVGHLEDCRSAPVGMTSSLCRNRQFQPIRRWLAS